MIRPAHRLSFRRAVPFVAAAAAIALIPSAALAADLFYSATLGLRIGDDARFFLNLTNQHFASPAPVATSIVKRCARPEDDFPVVMMLAHAAGRPADAVLALRLRGLSWSEVMTRINLSPRVLFVGLDHEPGPPLRPRLGSLEITRRSSGGETRRALRHRRCAGRRPGQAADRLGLLPGEPLHHRR